MQSNSYIKKKESKTVIENNEKQFNSSLFMNPKIIILINVIYNGQYFLKKKKIKVDKRKKKSTIIYFTL